VKAPAVVLCLALAAAAPAVAGPASALLPIYDSTQLALDSYVVIERIGVQGWRSAFNIPGYADEASARHAVLAQAQRVGADGVINLHCLGQTDRLYKPAGYYCYANAIRLRNERRIVGDEATMKSDGLAK
jgi:hypothetical protein